MAPDTKLLLQQLVQQGELQHLTAERVWQETARALQEATPAAYFELLQEVGALEVLMPELAKLWGIPNPPQWHPEIDTGIHSMLVLSQAALLSDRLDVRFAALCHDIGKGETPVEHWPSHHGHELWAYRGSTNFVSGCASRMLQRAGAAGERVSSAYSQSA